MSVSSSERADWDDITEGALEPITWGDATRESLLVELERNTINISQWIQYYWID